MSNNDLLFVYKSVIRLVLDFASMAYHTMLTKTQSERLERLQQRALKCIFGVDRSYNSVIEAENVPRLDCRREEMFERFSVKSSKNPRFKDRWFPLSAQTPHDTRRPLKYAEFHARTDRLLNSPLYQMRKRLNRLSET